MSKKKRASHKKAHKGGHKKGHNPHSGHKKKGHKRGHNPVGQAAKHVGSKFVEAAEIALGKTAVGALFQNAIPSSWRQGVTGNLVKGAFSIALGWGTRKIGGSGGTAGRIADALEVGGLVGAIGDTVDPIVLPKVAFNPLGDAQYFGELDTRVLQLAGVQPAQVQMVPSNARPMLNGPDQRVLVRRQFVLPG